MKNKKFEIPSMGHMSFSSKKVLASVVAGLLFAAPVFATVETVAPSLGLADQAAYAAEGSLQDGDQTDEYEYVDIMGREYGTTEEEIRPYIVSITDENGAYIHPGSSHRFVFKKIASTTDPNGEKYHAKFFVKLKDMKPNTSLTLRLQSLAIPSTFHTTILYTPTTVANDGTCIVPFTIDVSSSPDIASNDSLTLDVVAPKVLGLKGWKKKDIVKHSNAKARHLTIGTLNEQSQPISNMTVNCDVIKKTNGKYRLVYTFPNGIFRHSCLPVAKDHAVFRIPIEKRKPEIDAPFYSDKISFIQEDSRSQLALFDGLYNKLVDTQPIRFIVYLKDSDKYVLTSETLTKHFLPEKVVFDDIVPTPDYSFAFYVSTYGYDSTVVTPQIVNHFYNEETLQTEDVSATLEALLKDADNIKACDNYKNADDNLKQVYDKAITDGQKVYDKLSSTPEQVQQATEQIKAALGKLNGDAKSSATASQLQNRIQQLEQELEKVVKQQLDESQYEHIQIDSNTTPEDRARQISKLKSHLMSITDSEGQDLMSWDGSYVAFHSNNNTIKSTIKIRLKGLKPNSKVSGSLDYNDERPNGYAVKHGVIQGTADKSGNVDAFEDIYLTVVDSFARFHPNPYMLVRQARIENLDCWVKIDLAAELQQVKQQLQQTKQQLEKLKQDKTLSDQQKQAEIDKLNGQITNLGKQIEKLTQENTSLKGQIATLQATVARLTEEANQCHVSDGAKAQELEKVKQQLTQAQSDLEKLKADKTQSDQEKQKEIDRLSAQVTQLNQEIDKLKQEKSTLTQQLQDATSRVNTLNSQLEQLKNDKKQADEKNKQTISDLNTQVQQLTHDKEGLQKEINTKQGEITKLKQEIQTLKDDHSKSDQEKQKEIERLSGQVSTLTQEKQALQGKLDTANGKIQTLSGELDKLKQQHTADASTIQSLTQQLQQTKQQLEKLKQDKTLSDQQKQAEIDKLNGQITNLGKQIEKLTQENTSLKGQIATLQATVARLTEEANQCHVSDGAKAQELEKVKQQLTQAQSDLEKLKADKTQSDQEKQKEIERLSTQVTQLNQEITKLKQEKSTLTQQLQDATSRVNTLNSQLEKLKNDKKQADEKNKQTISDLNTQVQQLTHDKEGLQKEINTKQGEITKLKQEIQTLKDDHSKSDQEKQKEIERLSGQVSTLTQEKQALQGKLDTANGKIQTLSGELDKLKQQHTADASTIQSLTQQLQQTKQQLEKLKQDKTLSDQQKQAEIDKLNGQITNLGKQIEKLTQENTSLKGQIATLQATVARLTEEANQCHVSDGAKAQELEKVKQQLTQAQSDLEKLKQDKTQSDQEKQKEIDKLSAQVTQLNQEITKLKQEKSTITQQLQDATSRVNTLNSQLDKLKQQHTADASTIQSLTQQLQQTKQQLEDLKHNKTLSDQQKQAEIDKLNGQITNLGKQIEKLTQENTSLKGQIATLQATVARLTEEANQCHVSDGAKAQELEKVKQQLTQAQSDLEKLKQDKTQSDQEKQKEIDRLNGQVTQLNQEIDKLKQENPTGGSAEGSGTSTGSSVSIGGFGAFGEDNDSEAAAPASTSAMYRLYNPWTGEHLFTTDAHEVQILVALGWQDEGIIGQVSMKEGKAVYRLYNPNTGEHHYTTDLAEVERCVANGWVKEGIAFYSQGDQAVFSMYNPYAKSFYHHYTSNEKEIAQMIKDGWKKEEVKWYCAPVQPHNLVK